MSPQETNAVLAIDFCLLVFGFAYNALIAWAEKKAIESHGLWQLVEATTSIQVVVGTFVTLLGLLAIDRFVAVEDRTFGLAFGAFSASGVPMVLGSIRRYSKHFSGFWRRLTQKHK